MPVEIERKFLVKNGSWKDNIIHAVQMRQAYFPTTGGITARIRIIIGQTSSAVLTLKGRREGSFSRPEFEYQIPVEEGLEMMDLMCDRIVSKIRHKVEADDGNIWEVDVFDRANDGLVVAELELDSEDQKFQLPSWVGREVTSVSKYSNASLSRMPFSQWKKKKKK